MVFRWYGNLFICLLIIGLGIPARAQASIEIADPEVEYAYGESVSFSARLISDTPVELVMIFFQGEKDTHTFVELVSLEEIERGEYQLEYTHQLEDSYPLRAFSNVEYYYKVRLAGGELVDSRKEHFLYVDNRVDWNNLSESPFTVYWYQGSIQYAQEILDVAQESLISIQRMIPLSTPKKINIFVYPDALVMQEVLSPSSEDWIVGHADTDLGVIVVSIPENPAQRLLMEQRIPHELMHIALSQETGIDYRNLPKWLREGLASVVELYPNSDYRILLENAVENDSLLPLSSLCETFPKDAASALLSYAQATSFTQYLLNQHGASGMEALIEAYANGLDCNAGVKAALGEDLNQLERDWRQEAFSQDALAGVVEDLFPWLVLLAAILVAPIGLLVIRPWRKGYLAGVSVRQEDSDL